MVVGMLSNAAGSGYLLVPIRRARRGLAAPRTFAATSVVEEEEQKPYVEHRT